MGVVRGVLAVRSEESVEECGVGKCGVEREEVGLSGDAMSARGLGSMRSEV